MISSFCISNTTTSCFRTELLHCHDDQDFLAKVHCVRLAFDDLVASETHRNYFTDAGRSLMSAFLQETNQDASLFVERYNSLTGYLHTQENWDIAKKELTVRKVIYRDVPILYALHTHL